MNSTSSPTKLRKKTPREVFVYRYVQIDKKGLKRDLIGNYTAESDLNTVLHGVGPGRYRLEWRDAKRLVLKVGVYEVDHTGRFWRSKPLRKKRKVGRPQHVPPPPPAPVSPYYGGPYRSR